MRSPWVSIGVLGGLVTLSWLGACSDNPGGPPCVGTCPPPSPQGLVISNPILPATASGKLGAAALSTSAGDGVVYVSLTPGTEPAGATATVNNVTLGTAVTTALKDGGFDPIPLEGNVGDSVWVVVQDASGAIVHQTVVLVAAARPPIVVRTDPPPRKRDVPLNATMVIVFSEPVAAGTLSSSSVRLFRGATQVPATVQLLEGSATVAVLTPAAQLEPNSDYQLEITRAVRDLQGQALEASAISPFTTGTAVLGSGASISVGPDPLDLLIGSQFQLTATVRDAQSNVLAGRPITWSTDNAAVATVDATGLVTGVGVGSAKVSATSEGVSDTAAITVTAVTFTSVSAGFGGHACGLTTSGAAYCWGNRGWGALGDGSTSDFWASPAVTPVAVTGALAFSSLSAGGGLTCGITSGGAAYCWGLNNYGQLGDGSITHSSVPVAVTGGLTWSALSPGSYHTCGLTTTGAAYCWGFNGSGQLGDGSTIDRLTPVPVTGGLTFAIIGVGGGHTCGLTTNGAAYCWGGGALGDGTGTSSSVPVAVTGGFTFSTLDAGFDHACGIATNGAAYCWGSGNYGQLGDGNSATSEGYGQLAPVAVLGGLTFSSVSGGGSHTCGITTGGAAYCWGLNNYGELGIGSREYSVVPAPVTGGLTFSSVSAGADKTCGIATSGLAYCWGYNGFGALGNGTTIHSSVPVKVAGQP